jgi:hypothetical protein
MQLQKPLSAGTPASRAPVAAFTPTGSIDAGKWPHCPGKIPCPQVHTDETVVKEIVACEKEPDVDGVTTVKAVVADMQHTTAWFEVEPLVTVAITLQTAHLHGYTLFCDDMSMGLEHYAVLVEPVTKILIVNKIAKQRKIRIHWF